MHTKILLLLAVVAGCNNANSGWSNPPAENPPSPETTLTNPGTPAPTPAAPAATPAVTQELPTSGPNNAAFKMADGTYDLYIGRGVKEALKKGEPIPTTGWYKLGGVKQARVDKARTKAEKVTTISLEDPAAADMDIEIRNPDDNGKIKILKFKAGNPCVTGVVQVAIDPNSDSPSPLFDIIEWVRYPNGPTVNNTYTTGVLGDSEWPALKNKTAPPADCK